jgi:hypothetical protein
LHSITTGIAAEKCIAIPADGELPGQTRWQAAQKAVFEVEFLQQTLDF